MSLQENQHDEDARLETAAAAAGTLKAIAPRIAFRLVVPSLTNPRKDFAEGPLQELAESIKILDVIEPVILRPLPAARMADTAGMRPRPTHELVAGERRYRAAQLAGLADIPYVERDLTDAQALEIQLIENVQRDNLKPLEEAAGFRALMDATGISAKDLGARVNRSRAYVYNTLKLLDLCQESRDALVAGKMDRSHAELLGTVADPKLQLKALKEFTNTGWNERKPSFRECKDWLERNILLKIKDAPFDTKDATLIEACGACASCPKRTHADRDMFAAFDGPDMCTDPKCWNDKEASHVARIKVKAEAEGSQVIVGKEAKKLKERYSDNIKGYVRLDAKHDDGKGNEVTIKKLLGADAPAPIVFVDPDTHKPIKVLPTAVVGQMLKEKGVVKETPAEKNAKHEAALERERLKQQIEDVTRERAIDQVGAKIAEGAVSGFTAPLLRLLLLEQLDDSYRNDPAPLLRLWHLPDHEDYHKRRRTLAAHVSAAPDDQLGILLLQVLAAKDANHSYMIDKEIDYLPQLAIDAGVDLVKLRAEVAIELKPAKGAKKASEPAPPGATSEAAPQGEGAREGTPPAKAGKAARNRAARPAKLSPEEAQLGIAYAMQGNELGQAEGAQNLGEDLADRGAAQAAAAAIATLPHVDGAVLHVFGSAEIVTHAQIVELSIEDLAGLTGLEVDQAEELHERAKQIAGLAAGWEKVAPNPYRARVLKRHQEREQRNAESASTDPTPSDQAPSADSKAIDIKAGDQVRILDTVTDQRRLRWVGKKGAVLGAVGDRGWDVSFAAHGGGRVSFDRSELEVLQ